MRRIPVLLGLTVLSLALVLVSGRPTEAAPPASCVQKFIGTWSYSGGTTRIEADGNAYPSCFMCAKIQQWTCSGDTYYSSSGGADYTATLTNGGHHLVGSGVTAVRVDEAQPVMSGPTPTPAPPRQAQSEYCLVMSSAPAVTKCVGSKEQCSCLTVANTCPYPVSVSYVVSGRNGGRPLSLALGKFGKSSRGACTTVNAAQTIQYLGWSPHRPHPRRGEPKPEFPTM